MFVWAAILFFTLAYYLVGYIKLIWKYIIFLINSPIIDIKPLIVNIWENQYCM